MANAIGSILRKASNPKKLRGISFPTHERYSQTMSNVNADIYLFQGPNIKTWNSKFAQLPKNHFLLDPSRGMGQLPPDLEFDFILSQNKFGQFPVAKQLAQILHLPLISLEHCLPTPGPNMEQQLQWHQSMRGDVNLFISDFSAMAWGWKQGDYQVLHHGVNTNLFKPNENIERKPVIMSCVNDWRNRDIYCGFNLWQEVTRNLPVFPIGDTPGVSQPARNTAELVKFFQEHALFINTSLVSPIPTSLLEAMSCGCACVSTYNSMIPEILVHEQNSLVSNDPKELRTHCQRLLKDPELAKRLGEAARQTILDRFSEQKFVDNWNAQLNSLRGFVYVG